MPTRKRTVPKPQPTSPGDLIEFSITSEVKTRRGSVWVKVGVTSEQRDGEDSDDAYARISEFVLERVEGEVAEILS